MYHMLLVFCAFVLSAMIILIAIQGSIAILRLMKGEKMLFKGVLSAVVLVYVWGMMRYIVKVWRFFFFIMD